MANNAEELGLRLHALCYDRGNAPSAAEMQSLIAKGANVNTKDEYGMTVLHYAVRLGYLNAVLMLLAADGIDICAKANHQGTALMFACGGGNVEIVKALLAALKKTPNFDINDKNANGFTALMYACVHTHVEIVKILLSIPRINTNMKNIGGTTALDYAQGRMNEDEIMVLFQGELLPISYRYRAITTCSLLLSCSHYLLSLCSHYSTAHPF
jgi:ankyrin repeat protein